MFSMYSNSVARNETGRYNSLLLSNTLYQAVFTISDSQIDILSFYSVF